MAAETVARIAPDWYTAIRRSYLAGEAHCFLVSGDVDGTAVENLSVRRFLRDKLLATCDVVAVYHIAGGITIAEGDQILAATDTDDEPDFRRPEETRKNRALAIIGAGQPDAPVAGNALQRLTQGMGPQAATDQDPFAEARTVGQALPLLETLLRKGPTERVAVIFDYADTIVPTSAMGGAGGMSPGDRLALVTMLAWAKDAQIGTDRGGQIYLLSRDRDAIHADIRMADSGWKSIVVPLPDRDARAAYLDYYLARRRAARTGDGASKAIPLLDDLTERELANLTAGLSLRNIEDIMLLAANAGGLTRALLKEHKDAIITSSYSEVAKMIEPLKGGFDDIGGMQRLKDWAQESVIGPIRDGRTDDVPKGVLLVGPPGTGKTYFVRALAQEIGFTGVTLEAAQILGGIVGESERKLATFFRFARSLAPVLVFMDELDQSDMAKRGGNSGNPVASNLFNAMLQFLSDETLRGKVIMVFGSNRPDLMDPALMRFGRMDAIVPVMLPDAEERAAVIRVQAKGQKIAIMDNAVARIVARSEGYSSADLGAVVRKARMKARGAGTTAIMIEHAEQALVAIRPASTATARQYTLLAINACNDTDLLPPEYATMLNDRTAIDAEIASSAPLDRPRPGSGDERRARDER